MDKVISQDMEFSLKSSPLMSPTLEYMSNPLKMRNLSEKCL